MRNSSMKTIVYLVLILLLGGISYWVWTNQSDNTTLAAEERNFSVNTDRVGKIFLAKRSGESYTLERQGDRWTLNGKFPASENAMENLLTALGNMRIRYVPPKAARKHMIEDIAVNGIKVEVYGKAGEKLQTFYIGGTDADGRGTFVIKEDAEVPYVMDLPNWEGGLRDRFNLTLEEWRDKFVIREPIDEIQKVIVNYPRQQDESFVIERQGPVRFDVSPFYKYTPDKGKSPSQGAIESYLMGYGKVAVESFENAPQRRDSIARIVPFAEIALIGSDGDTTALKLYPFDARTDEIDFSEEFTQSKYLFRYLGILNDSDLVLIQQPQVKPLFRGYDYFFQVPRN